MDSYIKVVIIEDDDIIRNNLRFLISDTSEYIVCNTYPSFEKASRHIKDDLPDVILLDIQLPGINGIEAIPKLKGILPNANILILTVFDSEKLVFEALCNGATGYLTKNTPPDIIISSIREVTEGGGPMSAKIARMVIQSFEKNYNSPLSKREVQVLELIAIGKSRIRIANELFIGQGTLKTHIRNIYRKLEVNSKEDALKAAMEKRIIKRFK